MPIDPADPRYDPATAIGGLCATVQDWYNATKPGKVPKGSPPGTVVPPVLANRGGEFPYNAGANVPEVTAAFRQWLDITDQGLVWYAGEWWVYDPASWTWAAPPVGADTVVGQLFTTFWRWIIAACGANAGDTHTSRQTQDLLATLAEAPEMTCAADAWNVPLQDGLGIVLQANGMLRALADDGTQSMRMAKRADMLQERVCPRIAAAHDPVITPATVTAARSRLIDRLLPLAKHWNDPVREREFVLAMLSWASQLCMPHDRPKPLYKGAVFLGDTDTGKSTVLNLVTAVVGPALVSGAEIKRLSKDFGLEHLVGKLGWLVHETPAVARVLSDDILKQLLTNEKLTIGRKNRIDYEGCLNLLIGLCANGQLKHNDASDATLSRLMYFPMRTHFVDSARYDPAMPNTRPADPDLKGDFTAERNMLFEVLYDIASMVLRAGAHLYPTWLSGVTRGEYDQTNAMRAFVADAIVAHTGGGWVANTDLRTAYIGWIYQMDSWAAAAQLSTRQDMDAIFGILRRTFNASKDRGKKDGNNTKMHRGVHLNADGLEWWCHGMVHASGRRDKPMTDFVAQSKLVNRVPRGTGVVTGLGAGDDNDDVGIGAPGGNVTPISRGRRPASD